MSHNYYQKFLVFSPNTWITKPDFLTGTSQTEQCFSNQRKNILSINFLRLFYSDEISEKQMENKMIYILPRWKSHLNLKSCEAIYPFHCICKIWKKPALLLTKVMFTEFEMERGLGHTKIRILIFSEEYQHPWQNTMDYLATKDGENIVCS